MKLQPMANIVQWSRLVGGTSSSPSKKQTNNNSPQQRLIRFKNVHDQLQVHQTHDYSLE